MEEKLRIIHSLLLKEYGQVKAGLPSEIAKLFHQEPRRMGVVAAINNERDYQDKKWGTITDHPHDVPGWLLIMRSELNEASEAWVHEGGDVPALREILQVVSTGVAALEQHGVYEREKTGHGQKRG